VALTQTFIGLFGKRNISGNCQTSLLVFVLMLLSLLWMDRRWPAAGIVCGIALSKYSIGLPLMVLFPVLRKSRLLAVAGLTQLAAIVGMFLLTSDSPLRIVEEYVRIFQEHVDSPGIHVATLMPGSAAWAVVAPIALTALTFGAMSCWLLLPGRAKAISRGDAWSKFAVLHVFTITMLWTLLVAYHRAYDTFVVVLYFAIVFHGLYRPSPWALSPRQHQALLVATAVGVAVMSLPANGISILGDRLFQDTWLTPWLNIQDRAFTVMPLLMLAGTIWLLFKLPAPRAGHAATGPHPQLID
jgi:hypothetical protein